MGYLVNPEEEDEAVLFNSDGDLEDYEENPRRRKKRGGKKRGGRKRSHRRRKSESNAWKGHPRLHKRAAKKAWRRRRKRRAAEENPKRKGKKSGKKRKGSKRRGRKRRRVIRLIDVKAIKHKRHKRRGRKRGRKSKKGGRKRKSTRRRKAKMAFAGYEENSPRRRRHKRRHYAANPKRTNKKRYWRAAVYRANPEKFWDPRGLWPAVKAKPWHHVGFGILGAVDTGLIGMAVDMGMSKVDIPEWAKDTTRIVTRIGVGSVISYGIAKFTKVQSYGQAHQIGVYFTTTVDIIGTIVKYVQRAMSSKTVKITGPINAPLTPTRAVASMFGFGSLMGAMDENKLIEALTQDGLVVAQGDNGALALANANTGKIIISGSEKAMMPVIQSVSGIQVNSGTKPGEYDGGMSTTMGEDITVES